DALPIFDADIVGTPGVAADAEMAMMMADTLEAVGIKRGDYVIRVNNRKVLDGVLEAIGLGGDENAGRRLTVLRAIDKLDKFGPEGVALLLGKGRKDESGDFTEGAGLDEAQAATVLSYLTSASTLPQPGVSFRINAAPGIDAPLTDNETFLAGLLELASMKALFDAAGYGENKIKIDQSVVRGLEYYTGPVFEIELTFSVQNEKGQDVV